MHTNTILSLSILIFSFIGNPVSAQFSDWQNFTSGTRVLCTAFDGTYVSHTACLNRNR
jgi:hypothetical protein